MEWIQKWALLIGGIAWTLAFPLTFGYLVIQDSHNDHSFFGWIFLIIGDALGATLWPIYWGIVHWI